MKDYNNMPHGRFFRAYDALVEAYMNNRLNALDCSACAVGNIVKKTTDNPYFMLWSLAREGYFAGRLTNNLSDLEWSLRNIKPTGYSPQEILDIEKIFLDNCGCLMDNGKISQGTYDKNNFDHAPALYAVVEYLYSLEDWQEDTPEAKKALEYFAQAD